jgi:hypothetical protein
MKQHSVRLPANKVPHSASLIHLRPCWLGDLGPGGTWDFGSTPDALCCVVVVVVVVVVLQPASQPGPSENFQTDGGCNTCI